MSLKVGQVLWFRFRFNNSGDVSNDPHPYIVAEIDNENGLCEIIQMDTTEGKLHKALMKSNKLVPCRNPMETAISRDGFAQLDNTFRVELNSGLEQFRRTEDTITKVRLDGILKAYRKYHEENPIDEDKNVYMTYGELINLQ